MSTKDRLLINNFFPIFESISKTSFASGQLGSILRLNLTKLPNGLGVVGKLNGAQDSLVLENSTYLILPAYYI